MPKQILTQGQRCPSCDQIVVPPMHSCHVIRDNYAVRPKLGPRTILVHLNVQLPSDDPREAKEIAEYVESALMVGLEGGPQGSLDVEVALAEEV